MMKLLVYGGLVDNLVKKNDLTGLGIIEEIEFIQG